MSGYSASARTNYFRVKDVAAFREFADKYKLAVETHRGDPTLMALFPTSFMGTFILEDPDRDPMDPNQENPEIIDELYPHLADGEIAIIMESGHEKMCYVSGHAVAFNNQRELIEVNLNDIYSAAAKHFGKMPTVAEY